MIKLIDFKGNLHVVNNKYIVSINPFVKSKIYAISEYDEVNCCINYGNGWCDTIYMKEGVEEVYKIIRLEQKRLTIK